MFYGKEKGRQTFDPRPGTLYALLRPNHVPIGVKNIRTTVAFFCLIQPYQGTIASEANSRIQARRSLPPFETEGAEECLCV